MFLTLRLIQRPATIFQLLCPMAMLALSANAGAATIFPPMIPDLRQSAELSDAEEAMKSKDYLKALGIFSRKADAGVAAAFFGLGYMYQQGMGVDASPAVAERFYRQGAKLGNVPCMYNLASMLVARPAGVSEGRVWLHRAAEGGSGRAALALGRIITDGPDAKTNMEEAESWFRKAVLAPELADEASFTLAIFLDPTLSGTGERAQEGRKFLETSAAGGYQPAVLALSDALLRSKDGGPKALEVLKKADEAGITEATFRLAALTSEGRLLPANPTEALRLFQKAADAGHGMACNQLAGLYEEGKAVPKSLEKAYEWFRKGGELGLPMAQFNTGVCLENGQGTAKNPSEACVWYCRAAVGGYAPAQNRLALRYQEGQGVLRDPVAARAWLREAAQQGFEASILNYASMLADGQGGPRDLPTALTLYKSQAAKNNPDALYGLAILLESGVGTEPDPVRALALHELAADRKPAAKVRAASLRKVLAEPDVAQADAYVKDPKTLFN